MPGTVFQDQLKDGSTGPSMVIIPAGRFQMGTAGLFADSFEKPRHEVRIVKTFALGCYAVTTQEYLRCVDAGGCKNPEWLELGNDFNIRTGSKNRYKNFTSGTQPIVGVSWEDANAYAEWLSSETGKSYPLPSEAEWEYGARAGSNTKYSWGNKLGVNRANCNGAGSQWDYRVTAPVGSFAANGFGLYDMHGNVWEWVEDCWHDNYYGAPEMGIAWITGGDCTRRVRRGGSWGSIP